LCLDDDQDKLFIASYLRDTVCNETSWRTPRKADWSVHVQQQERSLSGFVGLKNLGCICYMNSIFQQLYMIPTFRKAIIEVEDRNSD
jgi:ubiquitin carboxyl-terminal hydrolase 9/24